MAQDYVLAANDTGHALYPKDGAGGSTGRSSKTKANRLS